MKIRKRLFSLILLSVFVLILVACNNQTDTGGNNQGNKTIPVYQGMVLSKSNNSNMSVRTSSVLLNATNQNEEIDQEDPFDNFDGSTIETEIEKTLDVVTSDDIEYYASRNEELLLTVKLLNPDNFVILSFTLNGTFYQSYQFQDGSDSENLVLKVNSGDVSGLKEYTIDAIKYVDGSDIKDVTFAGDRTIKLGVLYQNSPVSQVTNEVIMPTSLSFNVNVSDISGLIAMGDYPLNAVIYDGDSILEEKELSIGSNSVNFEKLHPGKLYQYAVYTVFDVLDGKGPQFVFLEKNTFYTNEMYEITEVASTQTSVSFDLDITDVDLVGAVTSIELYKGTELVEALTDLELRVFEGLLSNNEYTIKVIYTYDLNDGVGAQTVVKESLITTEAKATPEVSIIEVSSTQTSVSFDLDVVDVDLVGEVTSIELYKGSELVEVLTDLELRVFEGLLSNNEYTIKVVYTYDLNDDVGAQTITKESVITTLAKATPEVTIKDVLSTQASVSFDLDVVDVDLVGEVTSIELYKGSELVEVLTDLELRVFEGLLSNNEYTIKVVYTYDLNDDVGAQTITKESVITTLAKATPEVTIKDVLSTQASVSFDLDVVDVDLVGEVTSIELYKGSELVEALTDLTLRTFEGLLSNNEYTIKVVYTYDLNDGVGAQTVKKQIEFKSKPQVPIITRYEVINGELEQHEEAIIRFFIENPDSVKVEGLIIDGQLHKVDIVSNLDMVQLKYTPDTIGNIKIEISSILMDNQEYLEIEKNQYVEFFVKGQIKILDFYNKNQKEYLLINSDILIELIIPDEYNIIEIALNANGNIILIENPNVNEQGKIEINISLPSSTMLTIRIVHIKYEIDGEIQVKPIDFIKKYTVVDEVIEIYTPEDLVNIEYSYNKAYVLMNDIDLSQINNFYGIPYFFGVLDGNGFKIKNHFINVTTALEENSIGLIQNNSGTITNIIAENFYYIINNTKKQTYLGFLVAYNYGIVKNNKTISGIIEYTPSNDHIAFVAPLVGLNVAGDIINNYVNAQIIIKSDGYINVGEVVAGSNVGGDVEKNISNVLIIYTSND